jgi:ParB family chromosome partitioning protein
MAKSQPKITLSVSRDIPFNKLVLSQANVRRIKAGVAIEELAEDIARRTLLQSLTVRAILDESGAETGMYEVPAGGRRYRALELLVKKKRLARTAPIPCIVRTDGLPEEDSLAENVQRAPLHPLDQFRAFLALRETGRSEEEIAAAFFVSVNVVRQRLRLAAVSEKLLEVYAEDGMTLEQLMAFTVNPDHARQDQVWDALQRSHSREAYQIRRLLTEGAVRASDKRAQFVGIEAYEADGGIVLRDLFESDDGGWLQDPGLLDRLAAEKLEREAEAVRAEGWKWIEIAPDFPYGHTYGLRRLSGTEVAPSEEETAARDALKVEFERLEEEYADDEEFPEEVDKRLGEIETALDAFEQRPVLYDAAEVALAGAFVSIDSAGVLRIERGFVRREDEPPVAAAAEDEQAGGDADVHGAADPGTMPTSGDEPGTTGGPGVDRRGRGRASPIGSAHDRALGAPHAGPARRRGERPGRRVPGGAACPVLEAFLSLPARLLRRHRAQAPDLRCPGARPRRYRLSESDRGTARPLDGPAAQGARRAVGHGVLTRRRQPAGAVCTLRVAERQRRLRDLQPPAEGACARRSAGCSSWSRYGRGGVATDRRELPRPRHQGSHP